MSVATRLKFWITSLLAASLMVGYAAMKIDWRDTPTHVLLSSRDAELVTASLHFEDEADENRPAPWMKVTLKNTSGHVASAVQLSARCSDEQSFMGSETRVNAFPHKLLLQFSPPLAAGQTATAEVRLDWDPRSKARDADPKLVLRVEQVQGNAAL
jgi:hypothetical protein